MANQPNVELHDLIERLVNEANEDHELNISDVKVRSIIWDLYCGIKKHYEAKSN